MTRANFDPQRLAALLLLAPACSAAEETPIELVDALAFEDLSEQEVAERLGGDPEVSEPDEDETEHDPRGSTHDLSHGTNDDPVAVMGETPGVWKGVRRVTNYYLTPRYAEASWASPDVPGCSATMIAPNLLMTAAHCGADSTTQMQVQGRVYRDRDLGQKFQDNYDCSLLLHTFPETDLAIYHCPPEPGELSLGDRFGWVDIEPSEVTENEFLFSVFSNAINDVAPGVAQHLLTMGNAETVGLANHWANPNIPVGSVIVQADQSANQNAQAVRSNLWSAPGASGSAQFDVDGRIAVGPLSTGTNDGSGRNALGIRDYLWYGWVYARQSSACPWTSSDPECHTDNSVNGQYVSSLGLTPTAYEGTWVDQNLDYFFDLPTDVADLEGENQRSQYHLRFDSRWQNRRWQAGPTSSIDYATDGLSFDTGSNSWVEIARHEDLNLAPLAEYAVTLDLDSDGGYYRVCFDDGQLDCSSWFFEDAGQPRSHTLHRSTNSSGEALVLQGWNASGSIASVSVTQHLLELVPNFPIGFTINETAVSDFDSFDGRNTWSEPDGDRPVILPDGYGEDIDWAGRVYKAGSTSGYDYDLETTALPFVADDSTHEVCFRHRRDPTVSWSGTQGYLRITRADGSYVTGRYFTPGIDWQTTCRSFDAELTTGEALTVRFGMYGYNTHAGAMFIDDVVSDLDD